MLLQAEFRVLWDEGEPYSYNWLEKWSDKAQAYLRQSVVVDPQKLKYDYQQMGYRVVEVQLTDTLTRYEFYK